MGDSTEIYLEISLKRTFAVSVRWPGWCRSGKEEESAIQTLLEYGPRYAKIAQTAGLEFQVPEDHSSFDIIDRLGGNSTTEFGAPAQPLPTDWDPLTDPELERIKDILRACWLTFDGAVEQADGKELQKGPRGGGRDLPKIVEHVTGAEEGYIKKLGWKPELDRNAGMEQRLRQLRDEVFRGLEAAAAGLLAKEGPRGGKRWSPRYFVRRLAWHVVDHAWEIEDRMIN